jgi:hypothetical protein
MKTVSKISSSSTSRRNRTWNIALIVNLMI